MPLPIFACLFNCLLATVESSAREPSRSGAEVVLVPSDSRVPETDPTFAYLSQVVARALQAKGLRPVPSPGEGRTLVAIGWRRDTREVATGASENRYSPSPSDMPLGPRGLPFNGGSQTVRGVDGSASLAETLNPGLREANRPQERKVIRYRWTIELKALDPAGGGAAPLWNLLVAGDSPSEDPASIAPAILAAGMPFIGSSTPRKDVRISASDDAVQAIHP